MRHILLIDDDKDCLTALGDRLRFVFRGQNVEVDVADSAITGLMLCHASYYDVLIVDLLMPGTTGLKFVEQLRRTKPNVAVTMISGGDVKSCEEQAAVLGVIARFFLNHWTSPSCYGLSMKCWKAISLVLRFVAIGHSWSRLLQVNLVKF